MASLTREEHLHDLIDLLADRFKGYLPWDSDDPVVRSHLMFIEDTIKKADGALRAGEQQACKVCGSGRVKPDCTDDYCPKRVAPVAARPAPEPFPMSKAAIARDWATPERRGVWPHGDRRITSWDTWNPEWNEKYYTHRASKDRRKSAAPAEAKPHTCPHGRWNAADCPHCNAEAAPREQPDWSEALRVCDLPEVDEAIRNLIGDPTGDNATCLVRAILASPPAAPQGWVSVPKEPTMGMLAAVVKPDGGQGFPSLFEAAAFYEAMLSAAPVSEKKEG